MEYLSKNDFFLIFKPIYGNHGLFIDYLLISTSKNFNEITNLKADKIIGERVSKIIIEGDILGLKFLYDSMLPNTIRKMEVDVNHLKRRYLINIFSDERDYLLLVYNDIDESISNRASSPEDEVHNIKKSPRIYYKDGLTGLYNRSFFNEELLRLDTERQLPLSVIMGDVNGLKLVNDAFGHEMGDKLLKKAAEIMKKTFRQEDIISRIGGDEFAIILPNTTEEAALEIVKRLKAECATNPLDYLILSISFGVATKTHKSEDMNMIMQKADNRMYYMKIKESKGNREYLLNNLKQKLEETSFETSDHFKRLVRLSMMLADSVVLDERSKEELILLCEYHDIGKIGIPDYILQKEGPLSEDEWTDLKRHSEIGYHIYKETKREMAVNDLILIHHESWNGKGYPGFLAGEEIPLVVRIFSIAEAYEAMVNDRPYREKLNKQEALKEIRNKSGIQFDPNLARIFIELMQ